MTLADPTPRRVQSWLARRDAAWRLAAFVVCAAGVASLRGWPASAGALLFAATVALSARVPLSAIAARMGLMLLPLIPFAVVSVADPAARPNLVAAAGRLLAVGVLTLTLTTTAPPADHLQALARLGVPGRLVQVALLAERYRQLLGREARTLQLALRTRGLRLRSTRQSAAVIGAMAGSVWARAESRAERVADAMQARGYAGRFHPTTPVRSDWADVILVAASVMLTVISIVSDRIYCSATTSR